jgi:Cu/Ag efflux protein CusF
VIKHAVLKDSHLPELTLVFHVLDQSGRVGYRPKAANAS